MLCQLSHQPPRPPPPRPPQLQARDCSGPRRTRRASIGWKWTMRDLKASSWSQWSPPDLNCKRLIAVVPASTTKITKNLQRYTRYNARKNVRRYARYICQKECQRECQNICQKECLKRWQIECQNKCQIECQIECQSICQKECQIVIECQNKYAIYISRCQKLCRNSVSSFFQDGTGDPGRGLIYVGDLWIWSSNLAQEQRFSAC